MIELNVDSTQIRHRLPVKSNDLRYKKIRICTDADTDGYSISSQLINFFYKYWPELVKHDLIEIVCTPIVQVKSNKEVKDFYSLQEFNDWYENNNSNKWKISYKKGLAALDDASYKKLLHEPMLIKLVDDIRAKTTLTEWFNHDKEYIAVRKRKLEE